MRLYVRFTKCLHIDKDNIYIAYFEPESVQQCKIDTIEEFEVNLNLLRTCRDKDIHTFMILPKNSISDIEFHNEINEDVLPTPTEYHFSSIKICGNLLRDVFKNSRTFMDTLEIISRKTSITLEFTKMRKKHIKTILNSIASTKPLNIKRIKISAIDSDDWDSIKSKFEKLVSKGTILKDYDMEVKTEQKVMYTTRSVIIEQKDRLHSLLLKIRDSHNLSSEIACIKSIEGYYHLVDQIE
mmetsp:Transcript_20950/g.18587  ORF Transcript_20950/g.18587 Transcript_20950/m.18587 type:complete len:240 (+) Transcript_20950:1135-1854(+)